MLNLLVSTKMYGSFFVFVFFDWIILYIMRVQELFSNLLFKNSLNELVYPVYIQIINTGKKYHIVLKN